MNKETQKAIALIAEASQKAGLEKILVDALSDSEKVELKIILKNDAKNFDLEVWSYTSLSSTQILVMKTEHLNPAIRKELFDELTGLQRIDFFRQTLKKSFKKHEDCLNALVLINIHRFKVFNDSYGYEIGNLLLVHTAEQISLLLDSCDVIIARIYGDEFAFFLPDVESRESVISLVSSIRNIIEIPICIDEHLVHVKINIGVAFSDSLDKKDSSEELMRYANVAVGFAKENHFEKLHVFDKHIMAKIQRDLYLDTEIDKAIYMNNFHLVYQPIISTDNITLLGVEALIRWNHKTDGLIPPSDFIPLAERTGQIFEIEKFVLRAACEFMSACYHNAEAEGIQNVVYASVNISGQQLTLPGFVESVEELLHSTGLPPEYLRLEITETALMSFPEIAIKVLDQLHKIGLKISIDDFGTGYSSLAYLNQFHVDTLKIDGSFIDTLSKTKESKEIVKSILSLAKTLGLHVIAEGVEDVNQIIILKELGGVSLQGYYFSRPLEAEVVARYICASLMGEPFIPDMPESSTKRTGFSK
jgi:diguanylate cyclase (GGDEF)-like protein